MPEPVITTARTARHDLPNLFPGQAQKEAFVNEALTRLDGLLHLAVIDERANPPVDPAPGDCHIVGAAPTGAWTGHARSIAIWAENQWLYARASEGMFAFDRATGCLASFTEAGGWQRVSAPANPTGGATQDNEARAAISAILDRLRTIGIFG